MRVATALLLALLLSAVSGCGFQLRGVIAIPEHLKTLHLEGDQRSAVYQTVERTLEANGVELVENAQLAPYRIRILRESFDRRSASLNERAKTQEYELRANLSYDIQDNQGQTAVDATEIYTERTYSYDENSANAKESEEALIRQEMRENLAGQLVRRYLKLAELSSQ